MRARKPSPRDGFAFVELLAMVAILAIAAVIVGPHWVLASDTGKTRANHHNQAVVNAAAERWYIEKGSWPKDDLSDLAADPAYLPGGLPTSPISGSAYKLNPKTHRVD
jgi:general secretion pathway protein G